MKIRGQEVIDPKARIKNLTAFNAVTGCWEWIGAVKGSDPLKRYGNLVVGSRIDGSRRSVAAHRYSYEVFKGEIPHGMFVCHKCDNPSCVNPDHLFLGTRQDNINDRESKGRNKPPKILSGENGTNSKLTWNDVEEIRHWIQQGWNQTELAKKYKVSPRTISDIVRFRTWVPAPPKAEGEGDESK
jgi:flavodoxin